jgi:LemA protein
MGFFILLGIVLLVVLIFAGWWISTGNKFKSYAIKISEALSGIEVALTKRYDMLTKLLEVTKGYAAHEKELFIGVVELRRGMSLSEMGEKSSQMDEMSARMFAVAESYPELRSAEVFHELQEGIRDAEEHLQAARRLYNSNVTAYNTAIVMYPASVVANSQRLQPHEFFVAEDAKREDVTMNF